MVLTPTERSQYRSARIVTFSRSDRSRNFTLAQDGRFLVFEVHTSESAEDRQFRLGQIPETPWVHAIVSFRAGRLMAYLNGKPSGERVLAGDLTVWREEGAKLLVGNETDGGRPWKGRLERLAVYSRFIDAAEAAQRHVMVTR